MTCHLIRRFSTSSVVHSSPFMNSLKPTMVCCLPIFAAHQRGQAPNVEALCQILRLLRVNFHEASAPMLLAQLPQVLVHHFTAPRALAPEVDDDKLALLGDVEEVLFVDHLV